VNGLPVSANQFDATCNPTERVHHVVGVLEGLLVSCPLFSNVSAVFRPLIIHDDK
jgi:hypothetical protein